MKKLLVVLLALTALSVAAFADDVMWTWGLTVKTGATITLMDADSGSATLVPYDADDSVASRIRLDAEAALGDFAAHIRVGGDNAGTTAAGSAAFPTIFLNAWWVNAYFMDKMVQLQFGNLDHSVTDTVNKGWGGLSVLGAQVVVTPVSGLSVGLSIPAAVNGDTDFATLNGALAGMKVGFAYTMPNLVTVKATYSNAGGDKMSDVAGGVAILAVPNLTAQFEVQDTNIGDDGTNGATKGIELFEFASYVMGPLTPSLEMYQLLYNDSSLDMGMYFKPGIDYMVMTGTNVGLTFEYYIAPAGDNGVSEIIVDPYVKFTFNDKAKVKIDAAYTVPDTTDTATWKLPININFMYSF